MNGRAALGGDVAIVGAGAIGLSIAFELASRGAGVHVYDIGVPARAASWAAAGMLAPRTERLADAAMRELCEASLEVYPDFVQRLRDAGAPDPQLRLDGIVHAAYDAGALERLQSRTRELLAQGRSATVLSRDQTLLAEPALGKNVCGALLVHGEGQVDNRRLGRALLRACEALGVRVHTQLASLAIEFDARRALGVRSEKGYVSAVAVVNAAGAWAGSVAGVPADCIVPVRPVKGQMLAIEIPLGFMRRTTWIPGAYLVPRADGRLLVGATVEERGDTRVTAGGMHELLHAAVAGAPALREFTVSEMWAGLRPATPDERPCLGATPREGYYVAAGHYRNGILLAPITARLLADAIETGKAEGLAAFSSARFRTKAQVAQRRSLA